MSFVLKAPGKPNLYSFSVETEFKHIEDKVYDGNRYKQRDLKKEEDTLKELALDFIEIIQSQKITNYHLDHLKKAVIHGAAGVWETATSQLEKLAYHFEEAKEAIKELINYSEAKVAWKALSMLNSAFSTDEQKGILVSALSRKSKLIRGRAAQAALHLRNPNLINILEGCLSIEQDEEVKDSLKFAIKNMHQKPGTLTFSFN